jgi:hypothetical protein
MDKAIGDIDEWLMTAPHDIRQNRLIHRFNDRQPAA